MEYYMISLIYTYKCTSECDICGFSCSSERNEKMDIEIAKSIIRQARDQKIGLIAIVGGEPMLFQDEVFEIIKYCKKMNIPSTISTNCFWGKTKAEANDVLRQLMDYGVHHIKISTDDFHGQFVPYENVKNVIKAAKSIRNCKIVLACTSLKNSGRLKGLLEYLEEDAVEMNLMEQICYPVGRARIKFNSDEFIYPSTYEDFCNGQGILNISPDGIVYPCISMCSMTESRKIGSIYEKSLKELITIASNNKHNRFIAKYGVTPYFKEIKKKKLPVVVPDLIIDACHGCYELFENSENIKYLDSIVDELLEKYDK